jgi:hypothetical protein
LYPKVNKTIETEKKQKFKPEQFVIQKKINSPENGPGLFFEFLELTQPIPTVYLIFYRLRLNPHDENEDNELKSSYYVQFTQVRF